MASGSRSSGSRHDRLSQTFVPIRLLFSGSATGQLFAHDAKTGKQLWETQLYPNVCTPVTNRIDDRQDIALLSGTLSNTPAGRRLLVFTLEPKESLPGRPGS